MIAIDTSDVVQSVAWQDGDSLRSFHGHSPDFSLLNTCQHQPEKIRDATVMLVNIGPGRLTSTRVGCAFAAGCSMAAGKNLYGVNKGLLLSFWVFIQKGAGQWEVSWPVDSKHFATAVYLWQEDAVKCIESATLSKGPCPEFHFPSERAAMLMGDLYLHCLKFNLLNLFSLQADPVYLRSPV